MMYTLKHWSVTFIPEAYKAPEQLAPRLAGAVFGSPTFQDGDRIITSPIVAVNGRTITTESGSVYLLEGDPDPHYVAWLAQRGHTLDSGNPIVFKEQQHGDDQG